MMVVTVALIAVLTIAFIGNSVLSAVILWVLIGALFVLTNVFQSFVVFLKQIKLHTEIYLWSDIAECKISKSTKRTSSEQATHFCHPI